MWRGDTPCDGHGASSSAIPHAGVGVVAREAWRKGGLVAANSLQPGPDDDKRLPCPSLPSLLSLSLPARRASDSLSPFPTPFSPRPAARLLLCLPLKDPLQFPNPSGALALHNPLRPPPTGGAPLRRRPSRQAGRPRLQRTCAPTAFPAAARLAGPAIPNRSRRKPAGLFVLVAAVLGCSWLWAAVCLAG